MDLGALAIEDLQRMGNAGDENALIALGKKVLDFDFCLSDDKFCDHRFELEDIKNALDTEIHPDCPHCGKWITDV